MRGLLLISAILINLGWSCAYPGGPQGVGAFAYQDSTGNRYGGTYGLKDGQVYNNVKGDDFPSGQFSPNNFQELDDFFPEYFRNFENLLQDGPIATRMFSARPSRSLPSLLPPMRSPRFKPFRSFKPFFRRRAFETNFENQRLAYGAAKKAFDLTSNQAGYIPNFTSRFAPFNGFPNFFDFGGATNFGMPNFGGPNTNSAFASGFAGPGFTHQVAAISPPNPQMGNVNVMSRSNDDGNAGGNKPRYQSVSSSSYATSSNINGKTTSQRRAETVVNNDGKITKYEVHN